MRARVLMIAVWAMTMVGTARLFGAAAVPACICTSVLVLGLLFIARSRRPRVQPFHREDDAMFPPGPRRVLLAETGLSGPE